MTSFSTSAGGQCIRFAVTDVRVFTGRTSMGVRGINLADGDKMISLSILRHLDVSADERVAYLKRANAVRRGGNGDAEDNGATDVEEADGSIELGETRYVAMSAAEQFVLTISEKGFGKRTSSYEYRTTGRGGKGIVAMAITEKNGKLVASFPVEESDQIMLVTDGGQLIRCPVDGIRIAGRSTQGVIVFNTAEGEKVASVERLSEEGGEGDEERQRQRQRQRQRRGVTLSGRNTTMTAQQPKHATLTFERKCAADTARVFAALADPVERARWGTPSEFAALIYDETDFRVGGRDVFRCGSKANPQYRGVTTYYDIVPHQRIISSETVEVGGKTVLISMLTMTLEPEGPGTKVMLTAQVTSLDGDNMIEGAKFGNNAALDNLVEAMR